MCERYYWYQSDTEVVVVICISNAKEKDCNVKITRENLSVSAEHYEFYVKLQSPIKVAESSFKVSATKVEITLVKEVNKKWRSLKFDEPSTALVPEATQKMAAGNCKKKDKQKIDLEMVEAKGEEGLRNFFKAIYNSATPEKQMAMNKSFTESAGTVLSTNWGIISQNRVNIQPPTGTEYKQFSDWSCNKY